MVKKIIFSLGAPSFLKSSPRSPEHAPKLRPHIWFSRFAFYIMTISNIYALVNHLSTSIYEIAISIVTIHRFINFRQKMELRRDLTLKNVTILLFLIILSVLVRESSFVVWMAFALLESHHMLLEQTLNYYYVTFFVFQLLLFTALIVQFTMTSDGQNTHADIQIVRQVKIIGFIKLVSLDIICVFILNLNFFSDYSHRVCDQYAYIICIYYGRNFHKYNKTKKYYF